MGQITHPLHHTRSAPLPIGRGGKREAGKGISRLNRNTAKRAKREAGDAATEQTTFLERIRCAGGVAFMARDCRDVSRGLDKQGEGVSYLIA